jgi:hypothetical protein
MEWRAGCHGMVVDRSRSLLRDLRKVLMYGWLSVGHKYVVDWETRRSP